MSRVRRCMMIAAGAWAALGAPGCGGKLVPVKGVVLFEGKPLGNASVMFVSQEKGGRDATGYTDANGVFELSTAGLKDGAMPGMYKITVQYSEPIEVPPHLKSAEDVQRAMVEAGAKKPTLVLPPIYSSPDTTPLKHRVPDDGDVKLDLKKASGGR